MAIEENKAQKQAAEENNDTGAMDALLEKLRNGDNPRRRGKRHAGAKASPLTLGVTTSPGNETAVMALDMLTRLQKDGFIVPPSPNPLAQKRTRRRTERSTTNNGRETPTSPLITEMREVEEEVGGGESGIPEVEKEAEDGNEPVENW